MYRRRLQVTFAAVLAACFLLASSLAYAEESYTTPLTDDAPEPTAEAMLVDLTLLRPLGIVATVVGTAAFVVSLPFTLPTRSVNSAAQKLVVDPAKYTFVRPFGHTEFGLGYERQYTGTNRIRQ